MKLYKTKCVYGYSILGEKPQKINRDANYYIIGKSKYFPNCAIIQRVDMEDEKRIVPLDSMY